MFFLDARTARAAWTVLVFAAAVYLVFLLRTTLLLFAFSLFFAYLIYPLVEAVEKRLPRRGGRPPAIGIVYVLLLLGLLALAVGGGPRLTGEAARLSEKVPRMSEQIASGEIISDFLQRHGWSAAPVRQVEDAMRGHAGEIVGYAQGTLAALLSWLTGAWVVVLAPVFAFFFLNDADLAAGGVDSLLESRHHRALLRGIADDVHTLLGNYVRALILLSLITFVVWSAIFFLAGVPYPIGLAAIGGALEFLPVLGPITAGVIVVSVALFAGFGHPLLLVVFVLLWRLVQDYVSSPLVMGRGVEVHPAVIVFGVIAGGEIAGPAGMFLSVPVIAALRIVWRRVRAARTGTPLVPGAPAAVSSGTPPVPPPAP